MSAATQHGRQGAISPRNCLPYDRQQMLLLPESLQEGAGVRSPPKLAVSMVLHRTIPAPSVTSVSALIRDAILSGGPSRQPPGLTPYSLR